MYRFLIPLFVLAILAGCSSAPTDQTEMYNDGSSSSSAMMMDDSSTSDGNAMMNDDGQGMMADDTTNQGPYGYDGVLLQGKHEVVLHTTKGDITMELDADKAPKAVTNFVWLVKAGFHNGLTFHRVIDGFMIQGGDPDGNGTGGDSIFGPTFEDEPNDMEMVRGAVAMANRGPDTNGSQFFIVQAESTPWLQGRHTVFGRVTNGMDVVDEIAKTPRDSRDMPLEAVTYNSDAL